MKHNTKPSMNCIS